MKHKKTIIISVIVLAICFILIALFNSTYALFSSDEYAKKSESYSTGLLQIEAVSKTENISLTNVLPMSDDEGVLTDSYVFTIKNVGNLDYKFDVKLLSTGTSENSFSPQYIKIQVDDGGVMTLSELSNSVIKNDITLKVGESIDISIKVWLSWDTPNTELGKTFNSKIVTDGQAIYTESNYDITTFGEYISDLYVGDSKKTVINNNITYNYGTSTNLMNDKLGGTLEFDGGNVRYYGANPNNYIYFNCDDYTNQTSSTCEVWRIIGVFDGKVKLVRDDALGTYAYDYDNGTSSYVNDWVNSSLNNLLNTSYYHNLDNVVTYGLNATDGDVVETTTNFATDGIGIKNEETRNLITTNTWYLGNVASSVYPNVMYANERKASNVYEGNSGTWNGKIGLMYSSDYGYSTDLSLCSETLSNFHNNADCKANTWINRSQWILDPATSGTAYADFIMSSGRLVSNGVYLTRNVFPTLYLSENVIKIGGTGTSSDPYQISTYNNGYKGNAVDYVTGLYLSNKSSVVTNNSIEYQYASSVSLMNDRLGGTTSDYDAGNIRYYGKSPNNYVDIGDRDSSGNEILYRIIGVFKDIELEDGTTEDLIKVIRADSIGTYAWDNKTNGIGSSVSDNGSNDWSDARLMMLLNPGYDTYSKSNPLLDSSGNTIYGYEGSLWWNSRSGTCYSGSSNATKTCNFTSTGLSSNAQNKIETVVWNLGGNSSSDVYSNIMYNAERGTGVYSGRPTEWTGKVALMYPSDYGYATDFNSCSKTLSNYKSSDNSYACRTNDWLYNSVTQRLLTPFSSDDEVAYSVNHTGDVGYYLVYSTIVVRPVFYLNSELDIESGEGTIEDPYVLG